METPRENERKFYFKKTKETELEMKNAFYELAKKRISENETNQ